MPGAGAWDGNGGLWQRVRPKRGAAEKGESENEGRERQRGGFRAVKDVRHWPRGTSSKCHVSPQCGRRAGPALGDTHAALRPRTPRESPLLPIDVAKIPSPSSTESCAGKPGQSRTSAD